MKKEKENIPPVTVRFSIGAKLITIISIIVLVSLGSITALVSWLIREDLRIQAEDNNFEVNRRSAMWAEHTFQSMRSLSMILMQTVKTLEPALVEENAELFFEQNPEAMVLVFASGGKVDELLVNNRFFLSREIDIALADSFPQNNIEYLRRAALGETLLLNATPWFNTAAIAIIFPWSGGAIGVLFSSENLNDTFGFGTNQSYLINDSGDIIVHSDSELVKSASNVAGESFTRLVWESTQGNAQFLYTDEDGIRFFGAYTKLKNFGSTVITSIEYDKVFEGINATTRRNIYLTITVLSISILLIWFFSKNISIPLKTLAAAAHAIQGGEFELELKPKSHDEIGVLTGSFQRMSKALGIFGRFTNREIAVKAMRGEIKPGGLPKNATIFFSDIRNFTEKSEKFTNTFGREASNRIVHWLNNYFTSMIDCIEKTGGVVDKFIGDAVMAHWGTAYTAGSPEKDAFNCVKAALMMRKALYDMNRNRDFEDPGNPPIHIGCGINTGIVTAGQIGSDLRMEYTVIGDPVNLASRTESLNKVMATDVLITEYTWNLVNRYFITEEMPSVTVKGKENPVRIFAVINFAGINKGPRTLSDVRKLLGISAQDILEADRFAKEKKFNIVTKKQEHK